MKFLWFLKIAAVAVSLLAVSVSSQADIVDGLYTHAYGNPTKPAVLFLHGGPGYNSFNFEASTAQALARRGYYVVVFDQRGSGRSASPANLSAYTFASAVADVHAVATAYHLDKPILIGHSFGGTLAVKYAEAYPKDFANILLVDAPMDLQTMVATILNRCERFYRKHSDVTDVLQTRILRQEIFGRGFYSMNANLGSHVFQLALECELYQPSRPSRDRAKIYAEISHLPEAALLQDSRSEPFNGFVVNENWMGKNHLRELREIKDKVYGIFGADDGLFNGSQLSQIRALLPRDHFKIVKKASHNLFIDRQDAFLAYVDHLATTACADALTKHDD